MLYNQSDFANILGISQYPEQPTSILSPALSLPSTPPQPTVDEILKCDPGEKMVEDWCDSMDTKIAAGTAEHCAAVEYVNLCIGEQRRKLEDWKRFRAENAALRDKLCKSLNCEGMKVYFSSQIKYLQSIAVGEEKSARHDHFYRKPQEDGTNSRQALTHQPNFSNILADDVKQCIYDEFRKMEFENEYVQKVLYAEFIVKLYSDTLGFTKDQSEERLNDTPDPTFDGHDDDQDVFRL